MDEQASEGAVSYEWDRLRFCAAVVSVADPGRFHDVFLEGFLLHYRNVLDFLSPRPSARGSDILASDFVEGFVSKSAPVEYRGAIDKHLAHLSRERLTNKQEWPVSKMLDQIERSWTEFKDAYAAVLRDAVPDSPHGLGEGV